MQSELTRLIRKRIKAGKTMHIHYHDNGAWALYDRDAWVKWHELVESDEEYEEDQMPLPLIEGDDHSGFGGYLPDLVESLGQCLGITADSI